MREPGQKLAIFFLKCALKKTKQKSKATIRSNQC